MNINDFNSLFGLDTPIRPIKIKKENISTPENKLNVLDKDVFEKTVEKPKVFDIEIEHICAKTKTPKKITVQINPQDKGIIYKKIFNKKNNKIEKIPVAVNIAKSSDKHTVSYYFLEPETNKELGFVIIEDWHLAKLNPAYDYYLDNSKLLDDFPEIGIEGDRISIEYLQNNDEEHYSGIGKLSDQIAIEYCLQEGIEPNILSLAEPNSHAAHYKRGRRFLPVDKYDKDLDYYEFVKEYGTNDPNQIIEKRIKETPKGQKVDTSDLFGIYMYMPQNVIQQYMEKIEKIPILHQI